MVDRENSEFNACYYDIVVFLLVYLSGSLSLMPVQAMLFFGILQSVPSA
jgi:hypothetical protein